MAKQSQFELSKRNTSIALIILLLMWTRQIETDEEGSSLSLTSLLTITLMAFTLFQCHMHAGISDALPHLPYTLWSSPFVNTAGPEGRKHRRAERWIVIHPTALTFSDIHMNPLKQAKQFSIPDPLADIFAWRKLSTHSDVKQHTNNVSAQTQAFWIGSRLQPSQGPCGTWSDRVYASLRPDDPASQVSTAPNDSLYLQFMQLQHESKEWKFEFVSWTPEGQQEPRGFPVLSLSHAAFYSFCVALHAYQHVFAMTLLKLLAPWNQKQGINCIL